MSKIKTFSLFVALFVYQSCDVVSAICDGSCKYELNKVDVVLNTQDSTSLVTLFLTRGDVSDDNFSFKYAHGHYLSDSMTTDLIFSPEISIVITLHVDWILDKKNPMYFGFWVDHHGGIMGSRDYLILEKEGGHVFEKR